MARRGRRGRDARAPDDRAGRAPRRPRRRRHRDRLGAAGSVAPASARAPRRRAGRGDPLARRIAGDRGRDPTFGVVGDRDIRVAMFTPGGCGTRRPAPGDRGSVRRSALRPRDQGAIGRSLEPQWLADQGFAVLVADGRGTPGRGIAWEHAVYRDLRRPRAGGPGRRAPRRCRALRIPGPGQGRDPRMVVRRLPRGDGGPSPAGRLPRRGGRRAGRGTGPVRHGLHRAVPRAPAGGAGGLSERTR